MPVDTQCSQKKNLNIIVKMTNILLDEAISQDF